MPAPSRRPRRKAERRVHLQRGEPDVDPIEVRDDVEENRNGTRRRRALAAAASTAASSSLRAVIEFRAGEVIIHRYDRRRPVMKFGSGDCRGLLLAVAVANAHAAQQGRSIGGIGITVDQDVNYRGENATFLDDVPSLNRYGLNLPHLQPAGRSLQTGGARGAESPWPAPGVSNTESNLGRVGWNDRIQSLRRPRSGGGGGGGGGRPPWARAAGSEPFDKRNFGRQLRRWCRHRRISARWRADRRACVSNTSLNQ